MFAGFPDAVKQMTTAEGGMIISKDDYQESIDLMKAFGVDRSFTERLSPGQYDVLVTDNNSCITNK